jgi:hypothetical protein
MNGGTLWNQDYRGVNRKPELGVDGSRTAEPSSKVFAAFGARRDLLSTTRSRRLDAGRLHDRQEQYFPASRNALISAGEVGQDVAPKSF